jgi:DNA-binding transcriptional regulator YdaS (Cro superfamily)
MTTTKTTPLDDALTAQGRSASWLAERLGVHQTLVSRWVRGAASVPTDQRARVVDILRDDRRAQRRKLAKVSDVTRWRLFPDEVR